MGFKKQVQCKRCKLTTTYTNEVQYELWQSRPGCPACLKPKPEGDGDGDEHNAASQAGMGIAAVAEWYTAEMGALQLLLDRGVLTLDEAMSLRLDLTKGARLALGFPERVGLDVSTHEEPGRYLEFERRD